MNELDKHNHPENQVQKMPSINHSYIQSRLILSFGDSDQFTTFTELSLDASQIDLSQFGLKTKDELIPDICLYEGIYQFEPRKDLTKRADMPMLVIEILSPNQGMSDIMTKFDAYFALGVKSCWLVIPTNKTVTIYSQNDFETFGDKEDEIIDKSLGIHIPTKKVWGIRQ
jgi:Uma2 family endonuclease